MQPSNRQTSRPVGFLTRKYIYVSESVLWCCGNLAIVGQILEQIKLQLVWSTTRIVTLVWNHVACFHFHIIFAGWCSSLMKCLALSTTEMWRCLSVYPTVDLCPSGIISEVLDDVEKRSFTPQDPDDGRDFNISDNLHWLSLGEKVPMNFR